MMINKMVEMADFEGYSEKNNDNTYEYEKIMLETMFEDSSIYKSKDKDKNKDDASTLARFLFRLYYFVSNNLAISKIKQTDTHDGPSLDNDFGIKYKDICTGSTQGQIDIALDYLLKEINEKNNDPTNKYKKLYEKMIYYIPKLKTDSVNNINEAMAAIQNSCNSNALKSKIDIKSNIFKKDEYFKIDKVIYNSEKYKEKNANKTTNDNLKKETSNENKETTANNNTTNPA